MAQINFPLKAELIRRWGSQIEASHALGIREATLSKIVRGYLQPSYRNRKALERGLGQTLVRKLLG